MRKLTTEEFIERSKLIHGDKYDYSESEYINYRTEVKIKCKKNHIFWQRVGAHLRGSGCLECDIINRTKTLDKFIEEAKLIHGDIFDYSESEYINTDTKIKIRCKRKNHIFWQIPDSHLSLHGCLECTSVGTYSNLYFERNPELKDIPAKLYLYKFWNLDEEFYKVGITTSIRIFDHGGNYNVKLIKNIHLSLYEAFQKEQQNYKYEPKIKFGGHTECFSKEIYEVLFPEEVL